GFFYGINRQAGKLISAKAFQYITWASGVDMTTGRPIENESMRPRQGYRAKGVCPAAIGAKNWMPMALNPKTGIVFLPTFNLCMDMEFVSQEYKRGAFYLGADFEIGKPDRKSTRLNSSHEWISYAVFCLRKKNAAMFTTYIACRTSSRSYSYSSD